MSHRFVTPAAVLAACALLALAACSDSTTPRLAPPVTITGTVVDAEGAPVVGASIMLQHAFEPVPGSAAEKPQLAIRYTITERDTVDIWITSPCTGDTVRVMERQYPMAAGEYAMAWSGLDREDRHVGDGVYRANLVGRHTDVHEDFAHLLDDWPALLDGGAVAALATTDRDGAFSLDTACMPFGFEFASFQGWETPATRSRISRSVRVWAIVPGQSMIGSDWVTVDAEDGAEVVIAPHLMP